MSGARSLFSDYTERISKFVPCQISCLELPLTLALSPSRGEGRVRGIKTWLCDHGAGTKEFSSEALARSLETLMTSGVRELHLVIGGPDGFSSEEFKRLQPDLRWSFGLMTLPHELAAVVASEQIYRAFTIIRKLPYHLGH
ncbi:MAG: 23S rRNA (pseudouridine(1915)-N(3))-methyltransferase RlmH [Candidatus Omnitrophica bacterium]|nr:23S rRNA (pseudouridine(1915)-N(3))-methyltransferase RlmH [Candidatus Omnitrophota bacterium]